MYNVDGIKWCVIRKHIVLSPTVVLCIFLFYKNAFINPYVLISSMFGALFLSDYL